LSFGKEAEGKNMDVRCADSSLAVPAANISPASITGPLLGALGLTEAELAALPRQGFVSPEHRRGRLTYKLRFRFDGRQRVCFLGDDELRARAVANELQILQRDVRARRELRKVRRATRKLLKASKQQLHGILEKHGFHFRGLAVRRHRASKKDE
jgi:hypothetical protein